LSFDDVKFNFFTITYTSQVFLWVIFCDGSLVNKNVFIVIITVNEAIATSYIEPFYFTSDLVSYYLHNRFV